MALLSDKTRNATLRARTAMDILIIPKADFNKLRQSVPAFGDVFTELATRRAVPRSPHSSAEPSTLGGCDGHPIPIPTPESALGSVGVPSGGSGGDSGEAVIFVR
jgi:hypothetical protein